MLVQITGCNVRLDWQTRTWAEMGERETMRWTKRHWV